MYGGVADTSIYNQLSDQIGESIEVRPACDGAPSAPVPFSGLAALCFCLALPDPPEVADGSLDFLDKLVMSCCHRAPLSFMDFDCDGREKPCGLIPDAPLG